MVDETIEKESFEYAGQITAFEIEEDMVWGELAKKRDGRNARFVSHKKVWQ